MKTLTRYAIAADHIFDGRTKHKNAAVLIEGSQIASLVPQSELPTNLSIDRLPVGSWLAPGFVDLQVNGGGDRSEEHTSELQSLRHLVCRLLLEKKKTNISRKYI